MKLSKLYVNQANLFAPIYFSSGLNVVIAEIRDPANRDKDTHNLGKTTLGRLLDFCLLANRSPEFFLFKHFGVFEHFEFFLEIQLGETDYVTVRRSVATASKISFKKHSAGRQNFAALERSKWDHFELPLERSQELLDSLLDYQGLKPWTYRNGLGYQLRSQDDYGDVFKLKRFAGSHSQWKPFLAHILGFNADLVTSHYKEENQLESLENREQTLMGELQGSVEDISKIEGILLLKQREAEKKQQLLDVFDFRTSDKENTRRLVNEIDADISALNSERYSLNHSRRKILVSMEGDQILFSPEEAHRLFEEAGVLFEGQIKKDFQQLIAFNKSITDERRGYLQEELEDIQANLKRVNARLNALGKKRSETLAFLSDTDVFNKYRQLSDKMVTLRVDIESLERQRTLLHRLQDLRTEIRNANEEVLRLQAQIEDDVEQQNVDKTSLFSSIRLFFNEIVEEVIDQKALLKVYPNKKGHLEFRAEILDESGNTTSADLGYTYRKLLCIAFDLAFLRAHLDEKFPRFVFHDGVFESLDDRKKEKLLEVIRQYTELGIQQIITLIDADMPRRGQATPKIFNEEEIVLTLHDKNEQGRLFKTRAW